MKAKVTDTPKPNVVFIPFHFAKHSEIADN
jgi:hypothetical protein